MSLSAIPWKLLVAFCSSLMLLFLIVEVSRPTKHGAFDHEKMVDECNNTDWAPNAEDYLEAVSHTVAVLTVLCAVLFIITTFVAIECMQYIMKNYQSPVIKLRTTFIISVFPCVSMCSMLVLVFPRSSLLLELVASVFVALALYHFVLIIPEHYQGIDNLIQAVRHETVRLGRIPPCCCLVCCCPTVTVSRRTVLWSMGLGIQSAVLHPIIAIFTLVFWLDGKYDKGEFDLDNAYPYLFIPSIISAIVTIYGISLLAFVCSRNTLTNLSMKSKLYTIKVMLILRNTQGAIFAQLAKSDIPECYGILSSEVIGESINQMLFIVEMFLLVLFVRKLYRNVDSGNYYTNPEIDDVVKDQKLYGTSDQVVDFSDKMLDKKMLLANGVNGASLCVENSGSKCDKDKSKRPSEENANDLMFLEDGIVTAEKPRNISHP